VPGTLLGLVGDPDLQDRTAELRPGDAIVTYTDGLTEADAPRRVWTAEDLRATLAEATGATASGLVGHLVAEALGGLEAPRDDVAVLGVRMLPEP
jgi:serine phosphatase RsbU (regulator of sigma subunit)